jgi:hypothetical protein
VVGVVGALVALVMLAVGVILFFYRPSLEYMYVDLRNLSGSGGSGGENLWGILSASVIIAVVLTMLVRNRERVSLGGKRMSSNSPPTEPGTRVAVLRAIILVIGSVALGEWISWPLQNWILRNFFKPGVRHDVAAAEPLALLMPWLISIPAVTAALISGVILGTLVADRPPLRWVLGLVVTLWFWTYGGHLVNGTMNWNLYTAVQALAEVIFASAALLVTSRLVRRGRANLANGGAGLNR